jgi:hypothetical protein
MPGRLVESSDDEFTTLDNQTPDALSSAEVQLEGETAPQSQAAPAQDPAPASADGGLTPDDIPEPYRDKYQGKTAREMLDVVVNQESLMGRHSQELAELREQNQTLRGLVDKAVSATPNGPAEQPEAPLTDDDFTLRPSEAVAQTSRSVASEMVAPVDERLAKLEGQLLVTDFERSHPTAEADVNDPDFIAFVGKSNYRKQLAQKAFGRGEGNFDYSAADELWVGWEEHRAAQAPTPSGEETPAEVPAAPEGQPAAPAAQPSGSEQQPPALVTGNSSGAGDASGKPIYSQSELNRLQGSNPDLYWADDTQAKINAARAEGRIRPI